MAAQPSLKKIAKISKIVNIKGLPHRFLKKSGRETSYLFYLALSVRFYGFICQHSTFP